MLPFNRNRLNSLSVVPENQPSSGLRQSFDNLVFNFNSLVSAKPVNPSPLQQNNQKQLEEVQQQQQQQQKSDIEIGGVGGTMERESKHSQSNKSSITSLGSALQISIQRRTSSLPGFKGLNFPSANDYYDPRDVDNLEFLKLERTR
jgi:hypothetical protein